MKITKEEAGKMVNDFMVSFKEKGWLLEAVIKTERNAFVSVLAVREVPEAPVAPTTPKEPVVPVEA